MELDNSLPTFYAPTRADWRTWLANNYNKASSVWLIMYYKKSRIASIYYEEAVQEALCFGWIDSKGKKRDSESSYLYFAPRQPKSNWSKPNKERVETLIKAGLMTPAGQELIDLAKRTGTWDALNQVDNLEIPDDLQQLFTSNATAFQNFQKFPASSKRMILEWIQNARKPETRRKRVEETVNLAQQNKRANQWQP